MLKVEGVRLKAQGLGDFDTHSRTKPGFFGCRAQG